MKLLFVDGDTAHLIDASLDKVGGFFNPLIGQPHYVLVANGEGPSTSVLLPALQALGPDGLLDLRALQSILAADAGVQISHQSWDGLLAYLMEMTFGGGMELPWRVFTPGIIGATIMKGLTVGFRDVDKLRLGNVRLLNDMAVQLGEADRQPVWLQMVQQYVALVNDQQLPADWFTAQARQGLDVWATAS